jgi:hypothetical protein
MPQGGHPNGAEHERKTGGNEGIQAPLSKGIEKRKESPAGRIHQIDRLPPEIRRQVTGSEAGKAGHGLRRWDGGKNQAGEETARQGIAFTRSRDRKKNDNCFVEQKNGAAVREYIGYDRLEGAEDRYRFVKAFIFHSSLAPSKPSLPESLYPTLGCIFYQLKAYSVKFAHFCQEKGRKNDSIANHRNRVP